MYIKTKIVFVAILLCSCKLFAQAPIINTFSPLSGVAGNTVTISGTGFSNIITNNVVFLGNAKVEVIAASNNMLTIKTPTAASYSTFKVLNKVTGLYGSSTSYFSSAVARKDRMYAADFDTEIVKKTSDASLRVADGDLNDDSKKELVVISGNSKTMSIIVNTSSDNELNDNSFLTAINFSLPSIPTKVEIADMNGDGKLEIIVSCTNTICIFQNNFSSGQLNTTSFNRIDVPVTECTSFNIGDMDGDGRQDILCSEYGFLSIYKNNSSPTQMLATSFNQKTAIVDPIGGVSEIIVNDLDNDGRLDVVISSLIYPTLSIFHNQVANGILDANLFIRTTLNVGDAGAVVIGDFDGDGKKDLALALKSNYMVYFQNIHTQGTISASSFKLAGKQYIGKGSWDIKAGDLDGDGWVDFVITCKTGNSLSFLRNLYGSQSQPTTKFEKMTLFNSGNNASKILLSDLNGDGNLDVISLNDSENSIRIWKNRDAMIPKIDTFFPESGPSGTIVTIIGKNFSQNSNNLRVKFGDRNAQILEASDTQLNVSAPAGSTGVPISIYQKNSSRTAFSKKVFRATFPTKSQIHESDFRFVASSAVSTYYSSYMYFRDLDGDGFLDFIYINTAGNIIVQKNMATNKKIDCSVLDNKITISTDTYNRMYIADFDGDGLPDIIAQQEWQKNFYLKNTSSNGVIQFSRVALNVDDIDEPVDYDGDGLMDFGLYRNVTAQGMTIPQFKKAITKTGKMKDFDGDQKPDQYEMSSNKLLIKANSATPGSLSDSSFVAYPEIVCYNSAKIQDIDNDGLPDLIFDNKFYKNKSTTLNPHTFETGIDLNNDIVSTSNESISNFIAFGDINGDEKPEAFRQKMPFFNDQQDTLMVFQNLTSDLAKPSYPSFVKFSHNADSPNSSDIHYADILAFVDLNNDDKPEIVMWDLISSKILIFENQMNAIEPSGSPVITSFLPKLANTGATVTITGSNFNPIIDKNAVYFGMIRATVVGGSTTQLTVKVPESTVFGEISVLDLETKFRGVSNSSFSLKNGAGQGENFKASSFTVKEDFISGSETQTLLVADLDNDNVPEVVIVSPSLTVPIFKSKIFDASNNPSGFTKDVTYSITHGAYQIKGADFDGDGKMDMAVISASYALQVWENYSSENCNLKFNADYLGSNLSPYNLFLGDINNDGKIDILITEFNNKGILVFLNNSKQGSISFNPFIRVVLKMNIGSGISTAFQVKDIDGDGLNDLIISKPDPSPYNLLIYRNLSSKGATTLTFTTPFSYDMERAMDLKIQDLDGDGKNDIIISHLNSVRVIKNISTPGNINIQTPGIIMSTPTSRHLNIGDFDGDGKPDLLVAGGSYDLEGYVRLYRNKIIDGIFDDSSFAPEFKILLPGAHRETQIIDFNKDGSPDILVVESGKGLTLIQNNIETATLGITASDGSIDYKSFSIPVKIDSAIIITSPRSVPIANVTVSILGNFKANEDFLALNNNTQQIGNITAVYDKTTGKLTLSSANQSAKLTEWQNALQAVSYYNAVNDQKALQISFTLSDGINSKDAIKVINISKIPLPTIISFSPKTAKTGQSITILGENFDNITELTFGDVNATSFKVNSKQNIEAVVGQGASGNISIKSLAGTTTISGFTFIPVPILSANGTSNLSPGGNVELLTNPAVGYTYLWTKDNVIITSATNSTYIAKETGIYQVSISVGGLTLKSNELIVGNIFKLPADNFKISTTSATCKGTNNGYIELSTNKTLNYEATITGGNSTIVRSFTDVLLVNNLLAGSYQICITVAGQTDYKKCFDAIISEPKALSLFSVVNTNNTVSLSLSGAKTYNIMLNGKQYITNENQINLPLASGINRLNVSSEIVCQGSIEKTIIGGNTAVGAYPNPFDKIIYVNLDGDSSKVATVEVRDLAGKLRFHQNIVNNFGFSADLSALINGIYILRVQTKKTVFITKIIKK